MKYCLDFKLNLPYMDKIDEFAIRYEDQKKELLTFLETYPNHKINIEVTQDIDEKQLDFFNTLYMQFPLICLKVNRGVGYHSVYELLRDKATIPFFYDTRVDDWDTLRGLSRLGVSEMYICGDLGFELDEVSKYLHERNIKIRAFPNVCQSAWTYDMEFLRSFFIRPEDVDIYDKYIDVFEFFGNEEAQKTIFKAYAIDKQWYGKLEELIIGFKGDMDSRYIFPLFADKRAVCKKKCVKGGKCNICGRLEELASTLEEKHFMIKLDKK